jgi:hypothetical protein
MSSKWLDIKSTESVRSTVKHALRRMGLEVVRKDAYDALFDGLRNEVNRLRDESEMLRTELVRLTMQQTSKDQQQALKDQQQTLKIQELNAIIGEYQLKLKERYLGFESDDGSLSYAKAAGVYIDGVEAPTFPDRVIPSPFKHSLKPPLVILTFGQSNAANCGEGRYAAGSSVSVFNVFDMTFYKAIDPLPGASNNGAAVWGRLGDKLVSAGLVPSVIFVPIAFGGSFIREWAPGGPHYRRLIFALQRLNMAGLGVDIICWHQGEAEANLTDMRTEEYCGHFLKIVEAICSSGMKAPIYVAVATLCTTADHPFTNRAQIRAAQKQLVAPWKGIMPGPDTDQIGLAHRMDGCHFARSGLELHAESWLDALATGQATRWVL